MQLGRGDKNIAKNNQQVHLAVIMYEWKFLLMKNIKETTNYFFPPVQILNNFFLENMPLTIQQAHY